MTEQEILQYNKMCSEFLGYQILFKKYQYENFNSSNEYYYEWDEGDIVCDKNGNEVNLYYKSDPLFELEELPFHSDWDYIMEIIEAIEEKGSSIVMNTEIKGDFKINRNTVQFYFNPSNNYLLHLELKSFIYEDAWKHPMYKDHIIKEFDFKNKGRKEGVVEAIYEFLKWYNKNG